MKSTDTNLNNPLSVGDIDILKLMESWKSISIESITQEMYDRMTYHDPLKFYVIQDAVDGRIYLGEYLIKKDQTSCQYLVGIDENRNYILYMNMIEGYKDRLIPLSRYANPDEAFDAMLMANNAGSVGKIQLCIYSIIAGYIDEMIGVHDLIMGSMSILGYKNDPRLQMIIDTSISYGVMHSKNDLPDVFRDILPELANRYNNDLFKVYSSIYNVIVKYNFFKEDKYHNGFENLDLSQPIADILKSIGIPSPCTL